MPTLYADKIFTPKELVEGQVLEINDKGVIQALRPRKQGEEVVYFNGILCPGFINCHCHLELSALRGQISEKTGMVDFIKRIISERRKLMPLSIDSAIQSALKELMDNGIVALGDICNTADTVWSKKRNHHIYTHSFIELFGLDDRKVEEIWKDGKELASEFWPLPTSITSHAPYSTSSALIQKIHSQNPPILSIHLLESKEERMWMEEGVGPFVSFMQHIEGRKKNKAQAGVIDYITQELQAHQQIIWVHVVELTKGESVQLVSQYPQSYFCLCPRSNMYIHGTFPDLSIFEGYLGKVCVGTDSLASNDSLDIWAELKALYEYNSQLRLHQLLSFATVNGAKALGIGDRYGSFQPGSRPGINHVSGPSMDERDLINEGKVTKLY